MDEDDDKDDTKRRSRNLSEKKRRDQFNLLVNELCTMVSTNSRKMDKSTVLKSTIAFLKNYNEVAVKSRVHEIQENWKPSFLPNEEFTHLILEALDGFLIVFSTSGAVQYVSESITPLLEHLPNDLINMAIYDMINEDEHQNIYNILMNPSKVLIDPLQTGIRPDGQVTFTCHMKRGSVETTTNTKYDKVKFTGYFRENVDVENMIPSSKASGNFSSDSIDNKILFVGTGRLTSPQLIREVSLIDAKSEFSSRHSLEWKFLFLDHRAPPIIGYLPFEVLGTSGYDYYHFDDLEKVVSCHEALMQKGEGTSCFYRFLTKGQQWIWLQTRFYITYHQWNSKPEFVVCTHRVVSFSDVMRHARRKNHASPLCDNDENDEKSTHASSSNYSGSHWTSTRSQRRSHNHQSQMSPSVRSKSHRYSQYRPDSDSTSMSADSPISHHSVLTQNSSLSQRSRSTTVTSTKHHSQIKHHTASSHSQQDHPPQQQQHQVQPQIFTQYSIPQTHTTQTMSFQQQQSQQPHQPSSHMITTNVCHTIAAAEPPPQTTTIQAPFLDQSAYIAAIPMQPMFAAGTVIAPIPTSNDYVHSNVDLSPAQSQLQDHLQRKHEELQKIIMQQQDELRRVSEQLFIARYGIIPSIMNVQVPFVAAIEQEQSQDISSEGSQCMSTSSHLVHTSYYEPTPTQHVQMVPPQQYQQQMTTNHQQQHDPMLSQQSNQLQSYTEMKSIESNDVNEQNFLQSTHQQQQPQSQQSTSDFEMMSYHMMTSPWDNQPPQQQQQPQPSQQQSQQNQHESAN